MRRLMQQVTACAREMGDAKLEVRREVERLVDKLQHKADQVGR